MRLQPDRRWFSLAATLVVASAFGLATQSGGHDRAGASRATRIVVRFDPHVARGTATRLLATAGTRPVGAVPALHVVIGSVSPTRQRAVLAELRRSPGVVSAEPDRRAHASDATATAGASWQLARSDLPLAWQVTRGGDGVVVAVVDTGVQADHPGLQGRVLPGRDFVNADDDASDDNGHGTAVAGIVAGAAGPDGEGGTCPDCRILPVKVLAADGTGDWSTIAAGIVWAADQRASVINVSIGAPRAPDVLGAAIAYALAKGAIVVAAAGNGGLDTPYYPAAYPGVVSVAGVDANETRYSWSNYGPSVTVAAPGCAATTWLGGGYTADFCGTSAAAPFVSGLAGLAVAFKPGLTPAAFASSVAGSATALPDSSTAHGYADANTLLLSLGAPAAPPTATAAPSVTTAPVVGRRVALRPGRWQGTRSLTYSWRRSRDGVTWQTVGAGTSYVPRRADRGFRLQVLVTGANERGTAAKSSAASAPVRAQRSAPRLRCTRRATYAGRRWGCSSTTGAARHPSARPTRRCGVRTCAG